MQAVTKVVLAAFCLSLPITAHAEPPGVVGIISGKILTPDVNVQAAPGQAEIELTVVGVESGAQTVGATMTSPSGLITVTTGFGTVGVPIPTYPPRNRVTVPFYIESPIFKPNGLNLYSEAGAWAITSVSLVVNGTPISYTGSQLAALFNNHLTVNVINKGSPDSAPPAYRNGKILTPTVSLSSGNPVFAAEIHVADKVSGVSSADLQFIGPNNTLVDATSDLTVPRMRGVAYLYTTLQTTDPIGTYTIQGFNICDAAGNCVYVTSPAELAQIFGASSFQVTN